MNDLTVLVAEQDERQASLIAKALSQNSSVSQIIRFQDGQEVLDFLFRLSDDNRPGEKYVLVLGVEMPRVSGIEVLKTIKIHDTWKALPIIMVSSVNDPQVTELCYIHDCNAFIHKPVDCNKFEHLSMLDFLSVMQVPQTPKNLLYKSHLDRV